MYPKHSQLKKNKQSSRYHQIGKQIHVHNKQTIENKLNRPGHWNFVSSSVQALVQRVQFMSIQNAAAAAILRGSIMNDRQRHLRRHRNLKAFQCLKKLNSNTLRKEVKTKNKKTKKNS